MILKCIAILVLACGAYGQCRDGNGLFGCYTRPSRFGDLRPSLAESFTYNISLYSDWSEWSECYPKQKCSQERKRECLEEDNCQVRMIIEQRFCQSPEGLEKCRKYKENQAQFLAQLQKGCGVQEENSERKITGGNKVKGDRWPWLLSLGEVSTNFRKKEVFTHLCGATLISPKHAITAAHCLWKYLKPGTPKGEWVVSEDNFSELIELRDRNQTEKITFSYFAVHPDYIPTRLSAGYDVAILKLDNDYEAVPACIDSDFDQAEPDDLECHIAGYGATPNKNRHDRKRDPLYSLLDPDLFPLDLFRDEWFFDLSLKRKPSLFSRKKTQKSLPLMEAEVPIQPLSECISMFGRLDQSRHICAGDKGKDTCSGDSGGGLYCRDLRFNGSKWQLYGVTSFGSPGCSRSKRRSMRTVYSSIPGVQSWIKSMLVEAGFIEE